jgi:hypothetical protein
VRWHQTSDADPSHARARLPDVDLSESHVRLFGSVTQSQTYSRTCWVRLTAIDIGS